MTDSISRYSLADVAKCNGKNGTRIWIVIYDNVYDVTDYMQQHPGGSELIEEHAGTDATNGFDDFGHSSDAKKMLKKYLIGELEDEDKRINRKKKLAVSNGIKVNGTEIKPKKRRPFFKRICGKCA
ncbi:PREDICTED: cytochrome b5-like [Vollenhovia emeryi]|uniref:cytochrome b5-like n=1 Tax=Vollenhovia emeryi TaxID=411798 RepID=UPI0005F42FE9|nr:PREDICTED: cytochrome b5-like [Vollenhovia emeryi]